ncbi:uncharacterized protein G2W53_040105 [Senna tora]|uniref:Uncharacterized protein n=1 Tax=Senna tora TaxID=362788 RepID=A0A834T2B4_9FABA|nr:uncharacterized protein G2W53_040105 [Senna tora]
MMNDTLTICIYEDVVLCEEANKVAFHCSNHPKLTSINGGISFEGLRQLVHQTLKLQPNQQMSEIIYKMPFLSNFVRFFPCRVMDDGGVNAMLGYHSRSVPFLSLLVMEICANISAVQQEPIDTDYIPENLGQLDLSVSFVSLAFTICDFPRSAAAPLFFDIDGQFVSHEGSFIVLAARFFCSSTNICIFCHGWRDLATLLRVLTFQSPPLIHALFVVGGLGGAWPPKVSSDYLVISQDHESRVAESEAFPSGERDVSSSPPFVFDPAELD